MSAPVNKHGLTDLQEAFCREYVRSGSRKEHSAIVAGYGKDGARTRAWELLQRDDIQQRIREITNKTLVALAPEAMKVLQELMGGSQSDTVKQTCALALLDRAGFKHPEVIEMVDKRSMEEIDKELHELLEDQESEGQELH